MIRRLVGVGVLVIALAGCTSGTPEPTPPTNHVPVEIPTGVIAAGALTASTGESLGDVSVTYEGSDFGLDVPDLSRFGDPDTITVALADSPVADDACGDANAWQIGFPLADLRAGHVFSDVIGHEFPDPSFFTSVLVVAPGRTDATGCIQPILARAPLTWAVPVTHPWITVVDGGSAPGATGDTIDDGRLLYTTAAGDVWATIAERFGITGADLTYLNPIRTPGEPHTAFAGQVLNLDPANRGDSESRRPK